MLGAREGGFDYLPLNTHARFDELLSILLQFNAAAIVVVKDFTDTARELAVKLSKEINWIGLLSRRARQLAKCE